ITGGAVVTALASGERKQYCHRAQFESEVHGYFSRLLLVPVEASYRLLACISVIYVDLQP
ncbi:MAG: hypothetical protein ACRC1N_16915, partial [Aeromonas sobria]